MDGNVAEVSITSTNGSVDAKFAQLKGPTARPNKLNGTSSRPNCNEIKITCSHSTRFDSPLIGGTIGMRGKIHDWMGNYFLVDHVETGKSVTNSCLLSETMEG